ncbi:5-formyltetrahydrofolate cyclo-ligase [Rhodobacterales bacterium HKCCE3408]|nr:5-formyltetrahydrofolate cyclo-ligase [Rhodobacterales bacterium HKCCE3408]
MDKSAHRTRAFAARKSAFEAGLGAGAADRLLAEIGPVSGAVVAGYMAMRTEIDPLPAMEALSRNNRICVPVIEAAGQPLKFREWRPDAEMVDGPFGARVPAGGDWLTPGILIVPLVAFDRRLNRLGYGGGFYDRTLAGLRAAGPVRAIGFAFAAQELPEVPTEPTDQRLDAVVTETGTLADPLGSA